MIQSEYLAKIKTRNKDTFCIKFPKKMIDSGVYSLGDEVEVTISKKEVVPKPV